MNQATPSLAVDLVLINKEANVLYAIQRKFPPLGLALPGGFVEIGESCETAARREAFEETNLKLGPLHFVGVYSEPGRDPRKHVVSIAYFADVTGQTPQAGDDAREIVPISIPDVVNSISIPGRKYESIGKTGGIEEYVPVTIPTFEWCFDHTDIVKEAYLKYQHLWHNYNF